MLAVVCLYTKYLTKTSIIPRTVLRSENKMLNKTHMAAWARSLWYPEENISKIINSNSVIGSARGKDRCALGLRGGTLTPYKWRSFCERDVYQWLHDGGGAGGEVEGESSRQRSKTPPPPPEF